MNDMKINRKEKMIAASGLVSGAIVGAFIGGWIAQFTISRTIVFGLALIAIAALAYPVVCILIEIRKEEKANRSKTYPANWGFDKRFE